MARRYEVISAVAPEDELVFRPAWSGVDRWTWLLAVLGTGIVLLIMAIVVVATGFHVGAWLTVAVLVTGTACGLLWRRLVSGTTADAEGLTTVRIRTADLSWPDVHGLRLTPRAVIAYDATGHPRRLHHVPPTRQALAALERLWLAGRGADWTQSAEVPEVERPSSTDYRSQDPNAPEPVRPTTGLGTGFGMAALFWFVAFYLYSDLDTVAGWYETEQLTTRETIAGLLCFIGAPIVGFTFGLTVTRKKRRDAYEHYAAHRRKVLQQVRRRR